MPRPVNGYQWTDHPILETPSPGDLEKLSPGALLEVYQTREHAIVAEKYDPLNCGFELATWAGSRDLLSQANVDELVIFGGNRSGKSEFSAKLVVECSLANPGSTLWCFAQNKENSIQMQQRYVWKYLPPKLREKITRANGKDPTAISFSQKNGFSGGKLVFPNGSEIIFRNYEQKVQTIEGGEVGCRNPTSINLGVWCDELVPMAFLETLRLRLVTRDAKMLVTFTPKDGVTIVVKDYLYGAKTLASRRVSNEDFPQLPEGMKVPILQLPRRKNARLLYFHTSDNPYGGYDRLVTEMQTATMEQVLIRAYGVASAVPTSKFPKFSREVNVLKHEDIPFIKDPETQKVTRWMTCDPAGKKPWVMQWVGIAMDGNWYIYREFPDDDYGEWSVPGDRDRTKPGPAQAPNGYGYEDYRDEIYTQEQGEPIYLRLMDPRLGSALKPSQEGATTIVDDMAELGVEFIPAPGLDIEHGIQALNDLLAYDTNKPISALNAPRLYISDRCEQTIRAFENYQGIDLKEPEKDYIDGPRYLAEYPGEYLEDSAYIESTVKTW